MIRPLFFLLLLASSGFAEDILFIGNSYTSQIKETLIALVSSSPHADTKLTFITPGGRTLAQHLDDPKTIEAITTGHHSHVVLQDQSQTPAAAPEKFLAASAELAQQITASGGKIVYYQTWGRRDGDRSPPGAFTTFAKMQDALSRAYLAATKRDKALLAPVGEAFRLVKAENPPLFRSLYKNDASHPAAAGAYLASCCLYATVFGADPTTLTFTSTLTEPEAAYLRQVARRATSP